MSSEAGEKRWRKNLLWFLLPPLIILILLILLIVFGGGTRLPLFYDLLN
ncbi:MAG: hypothetical protein RL885_10885 [Planctomycetota bacterium]